MLTHQTAEASGTRRNESDAVDVNVSWPARIKWRPIRSGRPIGSDATPAYAGGRSDRRISDRAPKLGLRREVSRKLRTQMAGHERRCFKYTT